LNTQIWFSSFNILITYLNFITHTVVVVVIIIIIITDLSLKRPLSNKLKNCRPTKWLWLPVC